MIKPIEMYSVVCDRCGKTFIYEFNAIKAMATELMANARKEEHELYQDIIEKCNFNIAGLTHDDADQ